MNKRPRDAAKPSHNGKRRKGDDDGVQGETEVDIAKQEASVKAYMFHAIKLLQKALKKAHTVELQKLTRKLKLARSPKEAAVDNAGAADLEAQLGALKAVSLDPIPLHLLSTRLTKFVYLHPILPPVLASLPAGEALPELVASSVEGKARNRIMANKLIKEAWDEVSRAVAKRMGQEVEDRPIVVPVEKKKAKLEKKVQVLELPEGKTFDQLSKRAQRTVIGQAKAAGLPIPVATKREPPPPQESEDSEAEQEGGQFESSEEGVSGSEVDDDEDVMRELARLGSGSEASDFDDEAPPTGFFDGSDAEDSESDDVPSPESTTTPISVAPVKSKPKAAVVKPAKIEKVAKVARKESKPITSSAFLPSLAGGYISYSDSDGEDAKWVKESEKGEKKERKNRRGQQARQAIWEQKYGSGANHIVKTIGGQAAAVKGSKANRGDTRSAAKTSQKKVRTADAPPTAGDRHAPFDPSTTRVGAEFNPNTQPILARTASKVEKDMHPSWEAARRKAEAAANLAVAPRGKKITFD